MEKKSLCFQIKSSVSTVKTNCVHIRNFHHQGNLSMICTKFVFAIWVATLQSILHCRIHRVCKFSFFLWLFLANPNRFINYVIFANCIKLHPVHWKVPLVSITSAWIAKKQLTLFLLELIEFITLHSIPDEANPKVTNAQLYISNGAFFLSQQDKLNMKLIIEWQKSWWKNLQSSFWMS